MPRTRPRPSARPMPPNGEAPSFLASARPTSSAFTISATTPYTATVIPIATSASTNDCRQQAAGGKCRQCDRHDFRREDEVGLDGACDLLVFQGLRIQRDRAKLGFVLLGMMGQHGFEQFFHPFITEVGAAKHQQRRDHRGQEVAQGQGCGKQDQELVAQRSRRDLAHDRQLAFGGEADHIARRDRGVIDHDTRRLGSRLDGLARDIVKGSRRHFCDRRDIVEQGDQSDAHQQFPSSIVDRMSALKERADIVVRLSYNPATSRRHIRRELTPREKT